MWLHSVQTICAAGLGLTGIALLGASRYAQNDRVTGTVPLISSRGKSVIGMVSLFFSILIFLAQFRA